MIYVDTSVLVTSLTHEPATDRARGWIAAQSQDSLAISDWVVTEFSSALSKKVRAKQVPAEAQAIVLALFRNDTLPAMIRLPITRLEFEVAATFAGHAGLGLRGSDALHLAAASAVKATLATLDRRLAAAGQELGLATILV